MTLEIEFGPSSIVTEASGEFRRAIGMNAAQIGRASLFDLINPSDIPAALEALHRLSEGDASATFSARLLPAPDTAPMVSWRTERDGDHFHARGTEEFLTDAETRLRIALDVAGGGAWDLDIGRAVLRLDVTCARLFDVPDSAVVNSWEQLAGYVSEEDRERFIAAEPDAAGDIDIQVRLEPGIGPERYVAVRGRPNEGGGPAHVVGVAWNITESKRLETQLLELAMNDPLTGLANRRAFDLAMRTHWSGARRAGDHLAVIMVDIDGFKVLNDTQGHLEGDRALARVARCLKSEIHRPDDLVARYGGEEFAVLLPDTDADGAAELAERMVTGCRTSGLTISAGSSASTPEDTTVYDVLKRADSALYAAKADGKDQAKRG